MRENVRGSNDNGRLHGETDSGTSDIARCDAKVRHLEGGRVVRASMLLSASASLPLCHRLGERACFRYYDGYTPIYLRTACRVTRSTFHVILLFF